MPTYTVSERTQAEVWRGQYGEMQAWDLTLTKEGIAYVCQANTKVGNEFPAIGDQVEGKIDSQNGREIFKRARPAGSSGGGGSFQRDPKESASIVRQHSQQMAISWAVILDKKGLLPDRPDYIWLTGVIDWFQRDAKGEAQQ